MASLCTEACWCWRPCCFSDRGASATSQVEVARSRYELKARAVAALEERKLELTAETARNADALPVLEQQKKVSRQTKKRKSETKTAKSQDNTPVQEGKRKDGAKRLSNRAKHENVEE